MDFPSERDVAARLSARIREEVSFFKRTPVLACEEFALFSQSQKPKSNPILHPAPHRASPPIFEGVFMNFQLSVEPLRISFLVLKQKTKSPSGRVILFDMFHYKILYFTDTGRCERILNSSISVVDSSLVWQGEKFKITTPRVKSGIAGIAATIQSSKVTIPVNEHTMSFCIQVCCNIHTLYVLAQSTFLDKQRAVTVWANACGKNLLFMVRFIGFIEFRKIQDPNESLRGNNILSWVIADRIGSDRAINELCNAIRQLDFDNDDVRIECVLEQFDVSKVGPVARVMVKIAWDLAKQRFPDTNACYYSVTSAVLLRTVIAKLCTNNWWCTIDSAKRKRAEAVLHLNSKDAEAVDKVKKFIERLVDLECEELPVEEVKKETIEELMKLIQANIDQFKSLVDQCPFEEDLKQTKLVLQ